MPKLKQAEGNLQKEKLLGKQKEANFEQQLQMVKEKANNDKKQLEYVQNIYSAQIEDLKVNHQI